MNKSSDANNKPALILFLGILFLLGGGACAVFGFLKSINVLGIAGLVLLAVGALVFVFGIIRAIKIKKYKALYNDPNARVTDAKFVKAKMSSYSTKSIGVGMIDVPTSINVYKKIIYTYTDENGVEHTVTSLMSYTPNQVRHLESLGTFKIKCAGKDSAIIEDIPDENKHFNL